MSWDRLRDSYDHVAETYETRFLDELDGKPRDRELLDAFAHSVGDPVVELGSGPGQIGAFVHDRGRHVLGLDLSPEMARLAATRLDSAVAGDLRALPFRDRRVSGIVAFYTFIHLRRGELPLAVAECHRVLRPGGRLLFSAHNGTGEVSFDEFLDEPVPFVATLFQLDELVEAGTAAGFSVHLAEERPPYPTESATQRLYVELEKPDTSG